MCVYDMSAAAALAHVAQLHWPAGPNPAFVRQLEALNDKANPTRLAARAAVAAVSAERSSGGSSGGSKSGSGRGSGLRDALLGARRGGSGSPGGAGALMPLPLVDADVRLAVARNASFWDDEPRGGGDGGMHNRMGGDGGGDNGGMHNRMGGDGGGAAGARPDAAGGGGGDGGMHIRMGGGGHAPPPARICIPPSQSASGLAAAVDAALEGRDGEVSLTLGGLEAGGGGTRHAGRRPRSSTVGSSASGSGRAPGPRAASEPCAASSPVASPLGSAAAAGSSFSAGPLALAQRTDDPGRSYEQPLSGRGVGGWGGRGGGGGEGGGGSGGAAGERSAHELVSLTRQHGGGGQTPSQRRRGGSGPGEEHMPPPLPVSPGPGEEQGLSRQSLPVRLREGARARSCEPR